METETLYITLTSEQVIEIISTIIGTMIAIAGFVNLLICFIILILLPVIFRIIDKRFKEK